MINGMKWLASGNQPGDSLFLHYSGHGGQRPDTSGDELSGLDETIFPLDFNQSGVIVDDELNDILVKPLPTGVRLTVVFDSCHSGTALDLPFIYNSYGQLISGAELLDPYFFQQIHQNHPNPIHKAMRRFRGFLGVRGSTPRKGPPVNIANWVRIEQTKMSWADVIMFSGCRDDQTCADTTMQGVGPTGAMSYAFVKAISQNPSYSYAHLLGCMRDILASDPQKFAQVPQLSCGHPRDMNEQFMV